jgi:uncharacterized integral membrane protein
MKLHIKIDPYHFPLILIIAFVIGMLLAMALGLRPDYGSHRRERGQALPAIVQQALAWEGAWL